MLLLELFMKFYENLLDEMNHTVCNVFGSEMLDITTVYPLQTLCYL